MTTWSKQIASVAKLETILAGYRRLVPQKFDGSKPRNWPGRPATDKMRILLQHGSNVNAPPGPATQPLRPHRTMVMRDPGTRPTDRGKQIPGWTATEAKLRKHWSLLVSGRVPNSDVFALSLTTCRPSIETVMRKYLAGKHKGDRTLRSMRDGGS